MKEGRAEKISRMRRDPTSSTIRGECESTSVDQVSWKKRRLMEVEIEVLDWRRKKGRAGRESRVENIGFVFAAIESVLVLPVQRIKLRDEVCGLKQATDSDLVVPSCLLRGSCIPVCLAKACAY